jgi:hypothetical protein
MVPTFDILCIESPSAHPEKGTNVCTTTAHHIPDQRYHQIIHYASPYSTSSLPADSVIEIIDITFPPQATPQAPTPSTTSGPLLHSHTTPSPGQTLTLRNPLPRCSPPCRSSTFRGLVWPPGVFAHQILLECPTPSDILRPRNRRDRTSVASGYISTPCRCLILRVAADTAGSLIRLHCRDVGFKECCVY